MTTMRVSDYFAERLKAMGVKRVFLLSGGGMMHLIDAVAAAGLEWVCCHHEQACAMAAEAYARQGGGLGVCYATSGPGATNTLTGLVGAWQDSSPVLFLTGQAKRSQTIRLSETPGLRQIGTFEVDITPMVESVTKYAVFLDDPARARFEFEKAIHLATTGRPGPVLIDVPLDVQAAQIDPDALEGFAPEATAAPDLASVAGEVLARLSAAERPVLLVGHGVRVAGATGGLRRLAERLGAPVVTTQLAKDALAYDHPLFAGHCGPKGDRPGNFAVQASDFILSLGASLNPQTIGYEDDLYAPGAWKVQVDVDPAILDRDRSKSDRQVEADVAAFIAALRAAPFRGADSAAPWRERVARWKGEFAVAREPHRADTAEINFYEFAEALSEGLSGGETVVTDAGSAFYVLGQAFRARGDQRYLVSGAMGSMGWALPAAIGAAVEGSASAVVCVTGDGSLQLNIQELQTLKHYDLPVKLFVIDNDGYASIRNTQKGFFKGRYVGASRDSGVSVPALEKIAAAYGLPFVRADDRATLVERVRQAMATPGPVIVGVQAQADQAVMPSVASRVLPSGALRSNPLHVMNPPLPDAVMARELGDLIDLDGLAATAAA